MPQHPIKTKLDLIIKRFFACESSYSEARSSISETVDEEVSRVPKHYSEIVLLGEAKQNAFNRLKRKQNKLKKWLRQEFNS